MLMWGILKALFYSRSVAVDDMPYYKGFWRQFMLKNSAKRAGALFLVLSIWTAAVAFFPVSLSAQQTTSADIAKAKKDSDAKKQTQSNAASTTGNTSLKPLSAKEDPSQIGKRDINAGGDKFWGWL